MSDAPIVPLETLLAHAGWMRGLARTLVLDDARADDVVQETWATALREPPREGGSVRAWLASVVRSRAADARKAETRRSARETDAAWRGEAGPGRDPVADGAAATELHRHLTQSVMELPEPYRSAVILRFFEGLPPRDVGARTGVPAETARTRVNRGVAMLRERLDAEHGERRRWRVALAPIAGLGGAAGTQQPSDGTTGGWAMATARTYVAASIVVALGAGLWWWLRDDGAAAVPSSPTTGAVPPREDAPARAPRVREETPAQTAPPAPPPAVLPGASVRLRFVDETGAALAPDVVKSRWGGAVAPSVALFDDRSLRGTDRSEWLLQTVQGAGGALRPTPLDDASGAPALKNRVPNGRWRLVVFPGGAPSTLTRPFTVTKDGGAVDVDVVLAATPLRVVRVVTPDKSPAAGVRLTPWFEFGDDDAFVAGPSFTTDAAGEARLPVEPPDGKRYRRSPTWWASAPGGAASFQVTTEGDALVVALQPVGGVEGIALLADGSPAAGRRVCWRRKGFTVETDCDAEGRFRLEGIPATGTQQLFLVEDAARGIVRAASVEVKPGVSSTLRFDPPPADAARLVVRVTAGGRPVAGAAVTCRGREGGLVALTDADGTATLTGIPAGAQPTLVVLLCDPRVLDDFTAVASLAALASGEERKIALNLPVGTFRVRVVAADGSPVAGAQVFARPADKSLPLPEGWTGKLGDGRFSDDAGVAPLAGLPGGATCELSAFDGVTGLTTSVTAIPGTPDEPAEVTLTLK